MLFYDIDESYLIHRSLLHIFFQLEFNPFCFHLHIMTGRPRRGNGAGSSSTGLGSDGVYPDSAAMFGVL